MKKRLGLIIIILIIISIFIPGSTAQDDQYPEIKIIYPPANQSIPYTTPEIKAEFKSLFQIDLSKVKIVVDNKDVSDWDETTIREDYVAYTPSVLRLRDGNHTVKVSVTDASGQSNEIEWTFKVDTTIVIEEDTNGIDVFGIIIYILIGTMLFFLILGIYIFYLKRTKKFTFRKYFAQHPVHKEYFLLYLPIGIAFFFIILGFLYVSSAKELSPFSYEYVFIIGFFIAIIPYTIETIIEKRKLLNYERAFSQLLFEIADAMRGGLDPAKAIIELATTDTSILQDQLRRAADAVRMGRPFDEVMKTLVKPIDSDLVKRYASLIGEASNIGGETSTVIHRAAKDMDDFIKVNMDRRRQLMMQVTTIYIAFGVLIIILYQLLSIFPSLQGMDLSLLGVSNPEDFEGTTTSTRMGILSLKRRFFHVVLFNSIGSGVIIGELVDGKVKYGLIHAIVLTTASTIFFVLFIL